MKTLIDTCVLVHKITLPSKLINFAQDINKSNNQLSITDIIFNELQVTPNLTEEQKDISTGIINVIEYENSIIEIIDTSSNEQYKQNLDNIRKRFYSHVTDIKQLKKALDEGKIQKNQIKSLRKKDLGECSLIAVAITDPNNIIIVTDDIGRITLKPDINLFEKYKLEYNINIYNYDEFLNYAKTIGINSQKTI